MNKITILVISLMFGLMIFAVAIPESYAQTTKLKCKGTLTDNTNFKSFTQDDMKDFAAVAKMLDQCAKEKYQIDCETAMIVLVCFAWKN